MGGAQLLGLYQVNCRGSCRNHIFLGLSLVQRLEKGAIDHIPLGPLSASRSLRWGSAVECAIW
jgi:hypothetical protein